MSIEFFNDIFTLEGSIQNPLKSNKSSVGIGLKLVKNACEVLGISLFYKPNFPSGSAFYFDISLTSEEKGVTSMIHMNPTDNSQYIDSKQENSFHSILRANKSSIDINAINYSESECEILDEYSCRQEYSVYNERNLESRKKIPNVQEMRVNLIQSANAEENESKSPISLRNDRRIRTDGAPKITRSSKVSTTKNVSYNPRMSFKKASVKTVAFKDTNEEINLNTFNFSYNNPNIALNRILSANQARKSIVKNVRVFEVVSAETLELIQEKANEDIAGLDLVSNPYEAMFSLKINSIFETVCYEQQDVKPKKITILVADDEGLIRKSTIRLLKKAANNMKQKIELLIIECNDGIEMLYSLYICLKKNVKVDVIISDENMDFLSGSDSSKVLETLINNKILHEIPMFIVTALGQGADKKSFSNCVRDIYSKPISLKIVESIVNGVK